MGCAFLWWGLENHVADTREVFLEKVAPDFLAGTSNDEEAVQTAFSRNAFLCNRSYAQGINALLDGGDAQRATLFLNIIAEHCNDIEIVWSDFADSRQKDGFIVGLDGLLAADILNIAPLFDRLTGYLERHGNEDQLLRIFRYYHARALGKDGPSRDQARAALEKFFDIAGRNRELLERIRAVAGSDPSRYFSTSGVERVSFNLLQSAAASLDADLLRACLALGFGRENTRAGSVLFYVVYFHAGQAVINKLLAAGRKRQNLPEPENAGEAGRPVKPEGARRNPSPSTGRKENQRPVKPGDVRRK